jgi:MYXO-CTERM domain-containing protein
MHPLHRLRAPLLAGAAALAPAALGLAALVASPAPAQACGGLFCNTSQPVNQSAERILFAREGEQVHMHVQIAYQGPPTEFAWLLPAPPDVETSLSSEALFAQLDASFGPTFVLQRVFGDECMRQGRGASPVSDFDNGAPEAGGEGGVSVLSREAIGPYDRVILDTASVADLRTWLDDNGFAVPADVDARLAPYLEMGAVFVAIKLLPGNDAGDIAPLQLSFTSALPAVPILPTAVAADPDMGVIVHLLGEHRAIPKNYAHVIINDAAIDWFNNGQNYADVVSAAADEAEGKAWVTDFAGPHQRPEGLVQPVADETLRRIAEATSLDPILQQFGYAPDADVIRVLGAQVEVPEGALPANYFQCPGCFGDGNGDPAVDGAAVAAQLEAEVNPARESLQRLFAAQPYLTRLYTTLSAEEMDLDPIFSFNPDLGDVPNIRTATLDVDCSDPEDFANNTGLLTLPSGLSFAVDGQIDDAIVRQDGATVRGGDVPAARVVERMFEQGQPETVQDNSATLGDRYVAGAIGGGGGGDGCACDVADSEAPPATLLGLAGLLLLGIRRRRA